jgi:hypothetical protein
MKPEKGIMIKMEPELYDRILTYKSQVYLIKKEQVSIERFFLEAARRFLITHEEEMRKMNFPGTPPSKE